MSFREFQRIILDFLGFRNTILIILSFTPINVVEHWHEDDPVLELFGLNVLSRQVFLDLLKKRQWRKSWKFSPRIQLLLHRFPLLLGKTDTSWVLPLDLPILLSLLCCHSSVPDFERNLQRPTLLPSPIWSLNHEIILISSRTVWIFQSFYIQNLFRILHHQLLSNVEQIFNLREFCVLVDLQIRQIIRPKMDGGFYLFCMLVSRKLSRLLTCPTSFARTERSCSCIDGSCIQYFASYTSTAHKNTCSVSQDTQNSSWGWFRVLLEQTQSTMLWSCFPYDNIVGNRLCDFCKKSILLVVCDMPESIVWLILQACWPTIECQVVQFVPNTSIIVRFVSKLLTILQLIRVLPAWIDGHPSKQASKQASKDLKLWTIALPFLFASAQYRSTHFWACPSMSWDHATASRYFSVAPAEIRDSNIFLYCPMLVSFVLHSRWVHPKYTWSRNDVGSSRSTFLIRFFHVGATFCFFPSILMSSTQTDRNNPCLRWTWAHDFGHLCCGRRIHTSGHSDFGILSNLGASSNFTWV